MDDCPHRYWINCNELVEGRCVNPRCGWRKEVEKKRKEKLERLRATSSSDAQNVDT